MNLLRSIILAVILLFPISNSFGAVVTLVDTKNLKMVVHAKWEVFLILMEQKCLFYQNTTGQATKWMRFY